MSNFILNRVVIGDKTVVRYLMKQKGGNVEGKTSPKSAMWMLTNDKAKVPHMTEEFPRFPLTADGVYFFDGKVEGDEGALSPSDAGTSPSADGEAGDAVELGADGLPMPAGKGKDVDALATSSVTPQSGATPFPKGKAKKRRIKDVVCE